MSTNRDYDFILAPLMVGQPKRPVWVLTPWSIKAQTYIDQKLGHYPRFCKYSVGLPRNHVQNVVANIRNQGMVVK